VPQAADVLILAPRNISPRERAVETRFQTISEYEQELWISDVSGVPGFYAGLIEAGADYLEGWIDEMKIKRIDGPACFYELRRVSLS
jgi:hypothetical protein